MLDFDAISRVHEDVAALRYIYGCTVMPCGHAISEKGQNFLHMIRAKCDVSRVTPDLHLLQRFFESLIDWCVLEYSHVIEAAIASGERVSHRHPYFIIVNAVRCNCH